MPNVRLTRNFFYGSSRHRAGTVLDLPEGVIPKTAERINPEKARPERSIAPLQSRNIPRRDGTTRWQLLMGDRVIDEFPTKHDCELARIGYDGEPDRLRARLDELDEPKGPPDQDGDDAVS